MAEEKQECRCGFIAEDTTYKFCPKCGSDLPEVTRSTNLAESSMHAGDTMTSAISPGRRPALLSSPARRLGAYIVEAIILLGLPLLGGEILFIFIFIGVWIWELWCWTKSKTIGKHLFGMTVVHKETHQPYGFGAMFIREIIGKAISGFIFGLGFIWILIDVENQGWHDKLITSVVIDDYHG